ncbi:MAG: HAMP domain-containing protein [Spirochaetales bacterium]|nr:HAMP domain-containing protein [Spirochaetales bacterium]
MTKRRSSIFLRLFATMLFTAVFVSSLIFSLMLLFIRQHDSPPFHDQLREYTNYVFEDLDREPTLKHAQDISKRLDVDIRYRDSHQAWATNPSMPGFEELRRYHRGPIGIYKDKNYIIRKKADRFYLLYGHFLSIRRKLPPGFYFIIVLVLLLFVASYLFIRTIIKPVKQLQKAVEQIKNGNLDIQIPVRRRDELGELSTQFNTMTSQLRKMIKAKDQLLLDVSHELRSPLTRMKVAAEFIKDTKLKRTISEEVDGMESMLAEILETARLNSPHGKLQYQEVDLSLFVKTLSKSFGGRKPGIQIKTTKHGPIIAADPRRLSMLFSNILDNALRYSRQQTQKVSVSISRIKDSARVVIKDAGCGIPAKDMPYIFEPFYRVDPSRSKETGGYGIGFSLSKRIVEAHGGTITVHSIVNKGTKVTIVLPLSIR